MKHLPWIMALLGFPFVATRAEASTDAMGPVAMGSYSQTMLVTFKSEAAARQAQVHIAPLYHDLRAAFSTRMDDCNLNDLRVAEVMAKYGQRGTFYLNDPRNWWQDSPETGIRMPADPAAEVPRQLLARGNSIGDHTLTHEMLPALSKNSAFREILGGRVTLESHSVSPVIAFVYPDVDFKSGFRDGVDRADLEEMLRRSGFYQLAEHRYNEDWDSRLQDGLFIICDNSTNGGRYSESILTQSWCGENRPLFLVTMHAQVKEWGGPDFPKLAEIYRKWSGRADWWYCNHNQYGAYRYQALHSQLTTFVEGKVVRAVLTRPDPLDLGDWTPLTLKVEGVDPAAVTSVTCASAAVEPMVLPGAYGFDLFHDRQQGVIEAYGTTDNPTNGERMESVPAGPEGLRALLYRKGRVLTLELRNEGTCALEDVRVVFRLPLRWEEGVVRKQVGALGSGASVTLEVPLTERADPGHYSDGPEYDVAQVDFRGQRRVRLYATCEVAGSGPAAFFARNGFWVLGPLPGDLTGFDPQAFAQAFLQSQPPQREYQAPW
ncbi:MAG: polysaccharide deacetylase family protein, partial [Opitutaceae bacterium]